MTTSKTWEAIRKQQQETQEALDLYNKVVSIRQRRGQTEEDYAEEQTEN